MMASEVASTATRGKWICYPCWDIYAPGVEAEEVTIGRIVTGDPPCAWCGEPSETILNPIREVIRRAALVIAQRRAEHAEGEDPRAQPTGSQDAT